MKKVTINLYQFDELFEGAQGLVIERHREFMLRTTFPSDFEYEGDFTATIEDLENNDEPIIENIRINDYLFYQTGVLANSVTYCGNHPRAGITELRIGDDVYRL